MRSGTVEIGYNAASSTYIVNAGNGDIAFFIGDLDPEAPAGESRFIKSSSNETSRFGFITGSRSGSLRLSNVALGYIRLDKDNDPNINHNIDYFFLGYPTPLVDIPVSGRLTYSTILNGWYIENRKRPDEFYGEGLMVVDLSDGIFWLKSDTTRVEVPSGAAVIGGGNFEATGRIGSNVSGYFVYRAQYVQAFHISGELTGSFFGPNAEELGATFSGENSSQAVVIGALAGKVRNGDTFSIRVDDLKAPENYYAMRTYSNIREQDSGDIYADQFAIGRGDFIDSGSGEYTVDGAGVYSSTHLVPSTNNAFLTYRDDSSGIDTEFRLYKRGADNPEIQLTYVGFGQYFSGTRSPINADEGVFVYGFATPIGVVTPRTGTASYSGVSYGFAVNEANDTMYDVGGTSSFSVDFSSQSYSALLDLTGNPRGGGSAVSFGNYSASGNLDLDSNLMRWFSHPLYKGPDQVGTLGWNFYGPNGEEIGGTYYIHEPLGGGDRFFINGATVAKKN